MTPSLRKVVCMFRIKFPTKRIFRIFPTLRTDGMAPFGTYLWNDPRIIVLTVNLTTRNSTPSCVIFQRPNCMDAIEVSCVHTGTGRLDSL